MTTRTIESATGDLYDHESAAHHRALSQLEAFLRDIIGFKVVKKIRRERMLRVYPTKIGLYPLLNPCFLPPHFAFFDGSCQTDRECLHFVVYSQGDGAERGTMPCSRSTLDQHLRSFDGSRACKFYPTGAVGKDYYQHGRLILPVRFKAQEIDFGALKAPLGKLSEFLENVPASN